MRNNMKRPRTAEDMVHDAVKTGAHLPGPGGAAKTGAAPAEQPYDHGTGEGATPINPNRFARRGLDKLGGYFDGRPGEQFWEAPLGAHVRNYLAGQKVFGHTITEGQARMAEQGLAGLTAVGVGVPAFLAAVNQLSTPQTPDTIPM